MEYFVSKKLQPPSKEAIRAIANALNGNNIVRVYVKWAKRGRNTPFSIDEIRMMLAAVFDIELSAGRLIVLPDTNDTIGTEIAISNGSDSLGPMISDHPILGFGHVHFRIAKVIMSLKSDWRKYAYGHSDAMLPEPVGSQQGGPGIL